MLIPYTTHSLRLQPYILIETRLQPRSDLHDIVFTKKIKYIKYTNYSLQNWRILHLYLSLPNSFKSVNLISNTDQIHVERPFMLWLSSSSTLFDTIYIFSYYSFNHYLSFTRPLWMTFDAQCPPTERNL